MTDNKRYTENPTEPVSFKLPPAAARDLDERAKALSRPSRHLLAREIVLGFLADEQREHIRQDLADLTAAVERLRTDLATAVVALLVQGGHVEDVEQARDWVEKTILH